MRQVGLDQESLAAVKATLATRIAAIEGCAAGVAVDEMAREIGGIRLIAHRHGLRPAVAVARLLEWAVACGEQGLLLRGWLAILGEAVASEQQDLAACEAFAAACSVRLAEA